MPVWCMLEVHGMCSMQRMQKHTKKKKKSQHSKVQRTNAWQFLKVNGPHSWTVLTNQFVLKSHLQRFSEDCGIHDFFLIQDLFSGKNKSYEHSGVLLHTFQYQHVCMVVFSSLVQFNKIQYYSDNVVIFIYLFIHFIFLVGTQLRTILRLTNKLMNLTEGFLKEPLKNNLRKNQRRFLRRYWWMRPIDFSTPCSYKCFTIEILLRN